MRQTAKSNRTDWLREPDSNQSRAWPGRLRTETPHHRRRDISALRSQLRQSRFESWSPIQSSALAGNPVTPGLSAGSVTIGRTVYGYIAAAVSVIVTITAGVKASAKPATAKVAVAEAAAVKPAPVKPPTTEPAAV